MTRLVAAGISVALTVGVPVLVGQIVGRLPGVLATGPTSRFTLLLGLLLAMLSTCLLQHHRAAGQGKC